LQIALMEDDPFLELLTNSEHEGCRYLGQRIRTRVPYSLAGKWPDNNLARDAKQLISELAASLTVESNPAPPAVLFHYEGTSYQEDQDSPTWLDPRRFFIEETGVTLAYHPDYRRNFAHIQDTARVKHLWVFVKDESQKEQVKRRVEKAWKSAGSWM
jgi:hypothetical protein